MKTVILKWNPGFSSYEMARYLRDLYYLDSLGEFDYNWSVWDYEQIHEGDKFYWVKLGYGAKGIVGYGKITSEPYQDKDWSGQNRKTFYVDFMPEILINPDALPILDAKALGEAIPDFEWTKGRSGVVLSDEQAAKLDALWKEFVDNNMGLFQERANNKNCMNDKFYYRTSPSQSFSYSDDAD